MARPRRICGLLLLVFLALASRAGTARAEDFKVIVHPDNPVTSVGREFVRRAYLKKTSRWSHGKAARPIDLPRSAAARQRFTRDVLNKSPAQLKNYWNQQIFSGKGVPPPEAESVAAVIAYVMANPGAIAYLPAGVDPGGAKVVKLE